MYCGIELADWESLAVVRVTPTPPAEWALISYGGDWARVTEGGVDTGGSNGVGGLHRVVTLQGPRDVRPSDACPTSSAGSGACVPGRGCRDGRLI